MRRGQSSPLRQHRRAKPLNHENFSATGRWQTDLSAFVFILHYVLRLRKFLCPKAREGTVGGDAAQARLGGRRGPAALRPPCGPGCGPRPSEPGTSSPYKAHGSSAEGSSFGDEDRPTEDTSGQPNQNRSSGSQEPHSHLPGGTRDGQDQTSYKPQYKAGLNVRFQRTLLRKGEGISQSSGASVSGRQSRAQGPRWPGAGGCSPLNRRDAALAFKHRADYSKSLPVKRMQS